MSDTKTNKLPKVDYCLNVINGEPFIKYQLDCLYKYANQIIIVEGAYSKFAKNARGYRSKDKTLEIINEYSDPHHKIKIIAENRFYKDRLEMCNVFMDYLKGDILWQIDVDEFFLDYTHLEIPNLFFNNKNLDQISFLFQNCYRNSNWKIVGYEDSLTDVIRINRIKKGMKWINQRPPTLGLNGNPIIPREILNGISMQKKGHIMFNATMLFDDQVLNKMEYYNKMWPKNLFDPSKNWYEESWIKFNNKFSVGGFSNQLTYLVKSENSVPESLANLENDLINNKYKNFKLREDKKIRDLVLSKNYKMKVRLIERINSINNIQLKYSLMYFIFILTRILILDFKNDRKFLINIIFLKYCLLIRSILKDFLSFFTK